MLWHIMSQKFKPHQLQLWGCWVWLRAVGNKGSEKTSVQDISYLFKATQMPSPKQIQQATDAGSPTTVTRAEECEPIQLCPRLPPPASSLCSALWQVSKQLVICQLKPLPCERGGDTIRLSQGAFVPGESRHFAVGLLAAEHQQSWLPTPNIKCHFNSQPPGKPRPLEQWTHAK